MLGTLGSWKRWRWRALGLAALSTLALGFPLVGCGDDDGADATPSASTSVAASPSVDPCPPALPNPFSLQYTAPTPAAGGVIVLDDVTVEETACFDRITFTFAGNQLPGYEVKYVQAALQCGSGMPVSTQGSAQLLVTFRPVDAHDNAGNSTIGARVLMPGFASLKEAELACDFEAVDQWVLGTEPRFYTVTTEQNPARIHIDIGR